MSQSFHIVNYYSSQSTNNEEGDKNGKKPDETGSKQVRFAGCFTDEINSEQNANGSKNNKR